MIDGGYDEGYARCNCFWGKSAGSLVRRFISEGTVKDLDVLDLGCGEGKNAHAFASAGANVVALDCSTLAITNGRSTFAHPRIDWVISDAGSYLLKCGTFDIVVMYGVLHCLPSLAAIESTIELALDRTRAQGHHIVATFNDGPHDLSAHPGFSPTLGSHKFYLRQYARQDIVSETNPLIHEVHPHNEIRHFHSLTRLLVRKVR